MEDQKPREIKPFQNPELVVLRNPVAKARFGLSLIQQKFLFEVLAFFKSQPDQRVARFNVREYFGKLGISTNNLREYVREVEEMRRLDIKIPTGDNEKGINFIGVTLFASVEYRVGDDRSGYIEVEVSDKLKPFFLEIAKGDFFSYHILNTRVLKSTYSIKLYLLLKSYARLGKIDIALDELKDILEVDPAAYKQYPDFRKRVLERARLEMLEKNDICFEYREIRQNARNAKSPVVKIAFRIFDNPQKKLIRERNEVSLGLRRAIEPEVAAEAEIVETKTNLGTKKAAPGPKKGRAGEGAAARHAAFDAEFLPLFRRFDRESDDSFIIRYVAGLAAEPETLLDALHYAAKQAGVKNIYAYLPTILRAEAGRGLAEKARKTRQKAAETEAARARIAVLRREYEAVLDAIDAAKRDVVRLVIAQKSDATETVVEQVKSRYRGAFGIRDSSTVEEFRENPVWRSLVLHEFRELFPAFFVENEGLRALESQMEAIKTEARGIDSAIVF